MKIHIVQKGDTLWKIAKKYGVNFEELKKINSQLSNPDMIMPGMKIKVPTAGVPVKKEAPNIPIKEAPVSPIKEAPKAVHPFADMPAKPLPVIEDIGVKPEAVLPIKEAPAKEQPVKEQPIKEQPVKEQPITPPYVPMPQIYQPAYPEIDVNNYYMVNMAMMNQLPPFPQAPANVLPGMMKPEEEIPEMDEEPKAKAHKDDDPVEPIEPPQYQQPISYTPMPQPHFMPHYCVPVSPVLPGAGLPFQPMQPYPQMVSPQMMQGMPYAQEMWDSNDDDDFEGPDAPPSIASMPAWPTNPYAISPAAFTPPQYGYHGQQGCHCSSVSPVMPGAGLGYQPYGYQPFSAQPGMGMPGEPQYEDQEDMLAEPESFSNPTGYWPGVWPSPYLQQPVGYPSGVMPYTQQPVGYPSGVMPYTQQPYGYPQIGGVQYPQQPVGYPLGAGVQPCQQGGYGVPYAMPPHGQMYPFGYQRDTQYSNFDDDDENNNHDL